MSKATGLTPMERTFNYLKSRPNWVFGTGTDILTPAQNRRLEKKRRAALRREETRNKPINRRCERKECKAAPGQPCRTADGHPARKFHQARGL